MEHKVQVMVKREESFPKIHQSKGRTIPIVFVKHSKNKLNHYNKIRIKNICFHLLTAFYLTQPSNMHWHTRNLLHAILRFTAEKIETSSPSLRAVTHESFSQTILR